MSANVFLIIMPNQRIVVADLKAGRKPDPKYGKIAKQRSTHNNYLTLPVLFLMLSNHYPLAFATEWNWLIASLVFLMGVTIRHWFNTRTPGRATRLDLGGDGADVPGHRLAVDRADAVAGPRRRCPPRTAVRHGPAAASSRAGPAMACGMRIIARRITSAAVPWIGALIAARRAKPRRGPWR
jgi:hypothetical protein